MNSLKLKIIAAAILVPTLAGSLFFGVHWLIGLPESWREEGRIEERSKAKNVSDEAIAKKDLEFKQTAADLKMERDNHAKTKIELDAKFNNYIADVRAGRVAGLRIDRSSLCSTPREETARTSGDEEEKTVRLPRAVEEGLFRFAHDRDQIIADFESFKQEVRLAKCFAE